MLASLKSRTVYRSTGSSFEYIGGTRTSAPTVWQRVVQVQVKGYEDARAGASHSPRKSIKRRARHQNPLTVASSFRRCAVAAHRTVHRPFSGRFATPRSTEPARFIPTAHGRYRTRRIPPSESFRKKQNRCRGRDEGQGVRNHPSVPLTFPTLLGTVHETMATRFFFLYLLCFSCPRRDTQWCHFLKSWPKFNF